MSNEEQASWGTLIINLVAGGSYFANILVLPANADLFDSRTAHMSVGLVVLAIIASEVLLRIVQKRSGGGSDATARDERDTAINLRAYRNAHRVLFFAVVGVLAQIFLIEWAQRHYKRRDAESVFELLMTGPLGAMHVAQLLAAAMWFAAIAFNMSRVCYYRRGF